MDIPLKSRECDVDLDNCQGKTCIFVVFCSSALNCFIPFAFHHHTHTPFLVSLINWSVYLKRKKMNKWQNEEYRAFDLEQILFYFSVEPASVSL